MSWLAPGGVGAMLLVFHVTWNRRDPKSDRDPNSVGLPMSRLAVAFCVLNMQLEPWHLLCYENSWSADHFKDCMPVVPQTPSYCVCRLAHFDSDCLTSGAAKKRYSSSYTGAIGTKGQYAYFSMGYDFVPRTICTRWRYTIR